MNKCTMCRAPIRRGARFCANCGLRASSSRPRRFHESFEASTVVMILCGLMALGVVVVVVANVVPNSSWDCVVETEPIPEAMQSADEIPSYQGPAERGGPIRGPDGRPLPE